MKHIFTFAFCLFTSYLFAQLPDSDIWLLDVKDSAGKISLHNPININKRKGYDNQPAFSPDGKSLLYVSQRYSGGQTEIFKYDIASGSVTQITKTLTSEYSPTFGTDLNYFSVVMVELDSTQRIWKFPITGGTPVCVMKETDSVGYFCQTRKDSMAIYFLGPHGSALQVMNINKQKPTTLADSIGRCMHMNNGNLWYTRKNATTNRFFTYSFRQKNSSLLGEIKSEDFCFYKGQKSRSPKVIKKNTKPAEPESAGETNEVWWCTDKLLMSGLIDHPLGTKEIADLSAFGISKPSRITLSADGKKLAVVSNK